MSILAARRCDRTGCNLRNEAIEPERIPVASKWSANGGTPRTTRKSENKQMISRRELLAAAALAPLAGRSGGAAGLTGPLDPHGGGNWCSCDAVGVHFRSDSIEGLKRAEA